MDTLYRGRTAPVVSLRETLHRKRERDSVTETKAFQLFGRMMHDAVLLRKRCTPAIAFAKSDTLSLARVAGLPGPFAKVIGTISTTDHESTANPPLKNHGENLRRFISTGNAPSNLLLPSYSEEFLLPF